MVHAAYDWSSPASILRATKAHGRHLRMSQLGKQADLQHPWRPQHPLLLGLVHHLCHRQCAQPNHASCGTRPPAQDANRCPHITCSYFLRQALGTQVLTAKNLTESCKHGAISLLRRMFNMQFSRAAIALVPVISGHKRIFIIVVARGVCICKPTNHNRKFV